MRRLELPGFMPFFLALASALFLGCTGTSTESENTLGLVSGRALRAEGAPAAGARVALRTREIVTEGSRLAWRVLDSATADPQGRFEIKFPEDVEMFLEIREADSADPHPLIHFVHYDSADIRPGRLGDLVLTRSGSLEGRLTPKPGAPTENLWLGVAGTSVLVRLTGAADSAGLPFRLDGLPAGGHALTVAAAVIGSVSGPKPSEQPPMVAVAADTVTDAGEVFFEEAVRVTVARPP